jgi:hypothetical protein
MKKAFSILLSLFVLAGCGEGSSSGAKNDKGETPVKFITCSSGDSNCTVIARFNNVEECETHKKWTETTCESKMNSETMVCKRDSGQKNTKTRCTF